MFSLFGGVCYFVCLLWLLNVNTCDQQKRDSEHHMNKMENIMQAVFVLLN